ncbi:MAG: AAA family ATPase [Chloroflexaceae bacterium]|jgi:SpoVK/Ycf46/Vps4 family AAA+-type ATPase|nr:AAA family ATPase [Chloroflexaceae bacterium]
MPDLDATVAALRAALAVAPDNLPLRLHLAQLLHNGGRPAEAQAEYKAALVQVKTALTARPADADLYEQQAEIQKMLGDEAGALVSIGIAIALRGAPPAEEPARPTPPTDGGRTTPPPARRPSIEELENDEPERPGRLSLGSGEDEEIEPEPGLAERPSIAFADVGGMAEVKEAIRMAIIYPFQRPEIFAAYGRAAGGGLLLYGPPGCGKTYIARATAGEVGARFISVGISDILDMWHGQSEHKLHALFETARRMRPTVIFFDEIEAIGGNRLDMRQHFQRTLVNQFLAELDGAEGDNSGMLIVGATNSPWHVDSALRRPGRFDKVVFVAPPDEEARRDILRLHLRGKPASEDVDAARLARDTDGFSGADLRALVDATAEEAMREALRTGKISPLTTNGMLRALRNQRPSTLEWLQTAKNYVLYSNEGGIYDDVATYLRKRKMMR